MRLKIATAALAALSLPSAATAQVVVLTNDKTGGCVYKYNRSDAFAAAESDARAKWGHSGFKFFASNRAGAGAIFGAQNSRTGETAFFVRHGYGPLDQMIREARAEANDYIKVNRLNSTSFICGNWNNTGDKTLDTYPTYGEP